MRAADRDRPAVCYTAPSAISACWMEGPMAAPESLIGKSIEWTVVHHSEKGDFTDLSTHTVTYETAGTC